MSKFYEIKFPHRKNSDGTWDSICSECFRTVAIADDESELAEAEAQHICAPSIFAEYRPIQKKTA